MCDLIGCLRCRNLPERSSSEQTFFDPQVADQVDFLVGLHDDSVEFKHSLVDFIVAIDKMSGNVVNKNALTRLFLIHPNYFRLIVAVL